LSAATAPGVDPERAREPVLSPVERVSEMCFGLFMALTFVGAVSAAGAGPDPGRAMLYAALGCNLAWGLVDAVMYLVRTITERGRRHSLAVAVRSAPDAKSGVAALRAGLSPTMRTLVGDEELEAIRARLVAAQMPPAPQLGAEDARAAAGIFCIVALSTFPVALPFVLLDDVKTALLVSRALTLAMLFAGGLALGRYSGYGGAKAGFTMVGLGVALTVAIIALGG